LGTVAKGIKKPFRPEGNVTGKSRESDESHIGKIPNEMDAISSLELSAELRYQERIAHITYLTLRVP